MTIEYPRSAKDLIAYQKYYYENNISHSESVKKYRRNMIISAVFFALFAWGSQSGWFVIFSIVLVVEGFYRNSKSRWMKKAQENVKVNLMDSNWLKSKITLTLLDDKIRYENGRGYLTETPYSYVEKIDNDDAILFIIIRGGGGDFIIPFSAFESEEQKDEFIGIIKTKSEKNKEVSQEVLEDK